MGGYVILLIAPVIVGVLIATGAVVINGLRQRRIEALSLLTLPQERWRLGGRTDGPPPDHQWGAGNPVRVG